MFFEYVLPFLDRTTSVQGVELALGLGLAPSFIHRVEASSRGGSKSRLATGAVGAGLAGAGATTTGTVSSQSRVLGLATGAAGVFTTTGTVSSKSPVIAMPAPGPMKISGSDPSGDLGARIEAATESRKVSPSWMLYSVEILPSSSITFWVR